VTLTRGDFGKVVRLVPRYLHRAVHSARIRLFPPKPGPLILMYHRIADEPIDPWGLAVSPANFKEQLEVLRRTRRPLSLTDFVLGLAAKTLPADAVAVTFDDGYVDNLIAGKPLLAAADVPATVFLATGYLGRADEFWWDELAALMLVEGEGRDLEITIRGETRWFNLDNDTLDSNRWHAWLDPPRTARQEAYLAVWRALRALNMQEREVVMAKLRSTLASLPPRAGTGRPMSGEEVQALMRDRLITIGAHTVTHPALTELDAPARRREISISKHACEALTGSEVRTFAYPFGDLDADVRAAVCEAGFICACSSRYGSAAAGSDMFVLPRIPVTNLGGAEFERSLRLEPI
jgi:peptidoglycan/xylan/chitin deacetylase (PgdA/CDA1 family)